MTAGYSGTPLAKKVGVKPGHRLALVNAPPAWVIPELPDDVSITARVPKGGADVVIAFCRELATVEAHLPAWGEAVFPDGMVWIAWPRKAAGHVSDLGDNPVRALVLPLGLVDVKIAALSEDWSAMKVVWRKENRTR